MGAVFVLSEDLRQELKLFDTPTVCNALEALAPNRRGYGFTTEPLFCLRPALKPVVAVAKTATIRAAHPSDLSGAAARELSDAYYAYIDAGPKPSVAVIHDADERRGYGALWGEANSAIHKGLGCEGVYHRPARCATFPTSPRAFRCWPDGLARRMRLSMSSISGGRWMSPACAFATAN